MFFYCVPFVTAPLFVLGDCSALRSCTAAFLTRAFTLAFSIIASTPALSHRTPPSFLSLSPTRRPASSLRPMFLGPQFVLHGVTVVGKLEPESCTYQRRRYHRPQSTDTKNTSSLHELHQSEHTFSMHRRTNGHPSKCLESVGC